MTAATLDKHSYTGPAEVLEGPLGLFHSHIPDKDYVFNFARMTHQLGSVWEMREIEIKPYPCGHVSQPFVDCILDLYKQGLRSDNVKTLTCLVADWMVPVVCEPIERKKRPTSAWHGRVSLPYTIAEGLHFGQLDAASYRTENLSSPELLALIDKIDYQIDQTAVSGRNYKGWIKAVDKNGKAYEAIKLDAPDSNRSMSESDFLRKITNCFKLGAKQTNVGVLQAAIVNLPQEKSLREILSACEDLSDHV
jgi:2-methylcitrate dehydratase PrpD